MQQPFLERRLLAQAMHVTVQGAVASVAVRGTMVVPRNQHSVSGMLGPRALAALLRQHWRPLLGKAGEQLST